MSKMPAKKPTATKTGASVAKKETAHAAKPPTKTVTTKPSEEKPTAIADKPEIKIVTQVKLKQATPKEIEKLQDLAKWPIIMDEVGNVKTFYRMNELVIEFNPPLTVQRVQCALQRAFFGVSFNPDGSINDHREYTIPNEVNRLVTIIMEEKDIGACVEELRNICTQIHPDLFDAVFAKANVKESGRDNLDRLFAMTQTPDEIRKSDYYQFQAKSRSEAPFLCVWITQRTEIPPAYDNLFGPRFNVDYN